MLVPMESSPTDRTPDVAIILTLHSEGRTLRPTVYALGRAILEASAAGIETEVVVVLDRADWATQQAWRSVRFHEDLGLSAAPTLIETDHGDLGLARMSGIRVSTAPLVGVLDGDNLPTPNWIREAAGALRARADHVIAHPALIVTFDAKEEFWSLPSSEDPGFRPGALMWFNLWDAFSMAAREVFERFPYGEFRPHGGFGPEDWAWNCETVAAGVPHIVVPGTALFYRKKHDGSLASAHDHSVLPRNDLLTSKAVARAEIAALTATLAERERQEIAARADDLVSRARRTAVARRVRRWGAVDVAVRGARYLARPVRDRMARAAEPERRPDPQLWDPRVREPWAEYSRVQPLIPFPAEVTVANYFAWAVDQDDDYVPDRLAYWSAIDALPAEPDIVFFVPWIGTGGADHVATQYMNMVCRLRPDASVVLITTEPRPSTRLDLLDPRIVVFDLGAFRLWHGFAVRVIATLMTQLRPRAMHIINSTAAFDAVESFGTALVAHTRIFLSTYIVEQDADGQEWSFLFRRSRDYFERVSRLITDNSRLAERAIAREGVPAEKILVHHQIVDEPHRPHSLVQFSPDRPVRLAWVGRFDLQKRLDRLAAIVTRLRSRGVPFTLDVYGESVLGDDPTLPSSLAVLTHEGARFHPAYTTGFSSISPEDLDALIVTSQDEGTPNSILEAMSSGLPVIAPAVGDVPRLIGDETGFLVQDPDSVDEYVTAIESLVADHPTALARAANARRLVEEEFSAEGFGRTLEAIDGYLPGPARGFEPELSSWSWYGTAETRDLLVNGAVGILLYTGANGTSNFGDVLQTKNIVRYWSNRLDAPVVLLQPLTAAWPAGRHDELRRWLDVEHIVYFTPASSAEVPFALEPIPVHRLDALLHVVGGGYLNARFGAENFAAIEAAAAAFSVRGIVSSGLQIDDTAIPALKDLAQRHEIICVGVRDERSLELAAQTGLASEYTFDDISEVLESWRRPEDAIRTPGTIAIHLNTSDYVGGDDAREMWRAILRLLAARRPQRVLLLSAYADRRIEVRDALRSVADLAEDFPFTSFEVVDIAKVSLEEDVRAKLPDALASLATAEFAVTSSYHTAVFLSSLRVPTYLTHANGYFAQKAALFQLPSLETFLEDPDAHLLDLSAGLAARRAWIDKLDRIG